MSKPNFNPVHSKIERMALDILREEARINDACLSMAINHVSALRKLHDDAIEKVKRLQAVKRDIEKRAESIIGNESPDAPQ